MRLKTICLGLAIAGVFTFVFLYFYAPVSGAQSSASAGQKDLVLPALLKHNLDLYRTHKPMDLELTMAIISARMQETGRLTTLDAYIRIHEAELVGYTLTPAVKAKLKKLTGLTIRDLPPLTVPEVQFIAQHGVGYLISHWQDTNVTTACVGTAHYLPVAFSGSLRAGFQGCFDESCGLDCQRAQNLSVLDIALGVCCGLGQLECCITAAVVYAELLNECDAWMVACPDEGCVCDACGYPG